MPESFKVLVKELQALCLDVRVLDEDGGEIELSSLSEEDMEAPSYRGETTAEDVGETVLNESELQDSFHDAAEEDPDNPYFADQRYDNGDGDDDRY